MKLIKEKTYTCLLIIDGMKTILTYMENNGNILDLGFAVPIRHTRVSAKIRSSANCELKAVFAGKEIYIGRCFMSGFDFTVDEKARFTFFKARFVYFGKFKKGGK